MFIPTHTNRLSTTILVKLSDNISRTNIFGSWGIDFSFIWKCWINWINSHYMFKSIFEWSFKIYLVSVSSDNFISLQCSHVNNLPVTFTDDFPPCEQHLWMMQFLQKWREIVHNKSLISSFRLDFDFTIFSSDELNEVDRVIVIDNIPLGHSPTFACCTK